MYHRAGITLSRHLRIALRIIAFVGNNRFRSDIQTEVKQHFELGAIARFSTSEMECDRQDVKIGLEVDFGRKAAPRTPEGFAFLPPLASAAETWARMTVNSNI